MSNIQLKITRLEKKTKKIIKHKVLKTHKEHPLKQQIWENLKSTKVFRCHIPCRRRKATG